MAKKMMRKSGFTLILLLSLSMISLVGSAQADWGPDVQLTDSAYNPNLAGSNARCVAVDSIGDVHVVWYDRRVGNDEVYYKRSTDWGITWGSVVRLTFDSLPSQYPTVAVGEDGFVHVAWVEAITDSYRVFYKRSTDRGNTWSSDTLLSDIGTRSTNPALAAVGNHVYAVWWEVYLRQVYFSRSLDNGGTWSLPSIPGDSLHMFPSISLGLGGNIHVIDWQCRYTRSRDSGKTWSRDTFPSGGPVIHGNIETLKDDHIYLVWTHQGPPLWTAIYFMRSSDGGISWGQGQFLTPLDTIIKGEPVVAADSLGRVHVFYSMEPDDVMYICSTDGGTTWGPNEALVPHAGPSHPHASADRLSQVHVVWVDTRSGSREIYYKRWSPLSAVEQKNESPRGAKSNLWVQSPSIEYLLLKYNLPASGMVELSLFNVLGQKIEVLERGIKRLGEYTLRKYLSLPAGVYLLQMKFGQETVYQRIILAK